MSKYRLFGTWVGGCALLCGAIIDIPNDASPIQYMVRTIYGTFMGGLYGAAVPGKMILSAVNGLSEGCIQLNSKLKLGDDVPIM